VDEGAERSRQRQRDAADDQGGESVVAAEEAYERTLIGEEVLRTGPKTSAARISGMTMKKLKMPM